MERLEPGERSATVAANRGAATERTGRERHRARMAWLLVAERAFASQQVVVVLSKPMRFIADVLQ